MLLVTQATNGVATKTYFETTLTQGDYYTGQEVAGHWHGRGAEQLGLGQGSAVQKEHFAQLLLGYHPITGDKLTQRLRKDRRPGMDLTFSVPKSVSLAWAINDDERLLDTLRDAVQETMARDVEPLMARRVRGGAFAKTKQQQATGKLVYADFLHKTSRPVAGKPDPQLHVHAFVMNWTEDEGKDYAGEFEEIKRQAPSLQAKFHARLARKIEALGYRTEHTQYQQSGTMKTGWGLRGLERTTIEKFSRRTDQIEDYADTHGITDAKKKGKLGVLTRELKDKGLSVQELRREWQGRLTPEEREAFAKLLHPEAADRGEEGIRTVSQIQDRTVTPLRSVIADRAPPPAVTVRAEDEHDRAIAAVQYALDHHLYRQSTAERQQIVGTALVQGLNIRPEAIENALDSVGLIEGKTEVNGCPRRFVTTRSVLEAERRMIAYARDGRGTRRAIRSDAHAFSRDWLNEHQKEAVEHVLQSRDAVMAVVGGAGTGKTSMMEEAAEAIRHSGKQVFSFAPSTGAREVLQEKGFAKAQTVEHLIRNTKLHDELRDQVIWIDEAGLLDVRSMNQVFAIAQGQNARVVLSGDTRQHASPRRGEAMRLLEQEAGLKLARSEKIQRQKGRYRKAVELISRGAEVVDRQGRTGLLAGFDLLDAMGRVQELPAEQRHARLASTYVEASSNGKSSLVVAPTHAEKQAVTAAIRSRLRRQGKLTTEEREFVQYRSLNLTEAQKGEARSYAAQKDLVVQFHQNTSGGFQRGGRFRVTAATGGSVELVSLDGKHQKSLPLKSAERFEVYREDRVRLAVGDKLRFSLGGTTRDRKSRISNGRLDEVKGFDRHGNLVLANGWKVDKDYAHLDLGYVITSHASQGKDRDVAIAAMGSRSLPAINARQFYVTVSRGREDVVLFVDDKRKVREAIQGSGKQLSATELVQSGGAIEEKRGRGREPLLEWVRRANHYRQRVMAWWRGQGRGRVAGPRHQRPQPSHARLGRGIDRSPTPDGGRA